MEQKCEECMFWKKFLERDGECHRNAPSPSRYSINRQKDEQQTNDNVLSGTRWPMTHYNQWCGEFHEKQSD